MGKLLEFKKPPTPTNKIAAQLQNALKRMHQSLEKLRAAMEGKIENKDSK